MGMQVEDNDGQKAGNVRDLVLNARNGQVKYVVIGSGGFLGVRSTLRIAPVQIVSTATTKRGVLALKATTGQWNHAPPFRTSELASLAEPRRAREISSYFAQPRARTTNTAVKGLAATGHDQAQHDPQRETLIFASQLIGLRVVNQEQERLGEISDLLLDLGHPHPAFAIVSNGKFVHQDNDYAIPLTAFSADGNKKSLLVNVDMTALQRAPVFGQKAWQTAEKGENPQFYRYIRTNE